MTENIKFYWNGIKVDGGKLTKCYFWTDDKTGAVTISARDYDNLPRDLFNVKNDTDLYTDYFDKDSATLDPSHPLHKYAAFAAYKSKLHDAQRQVDFYERRAEKLSYDPRRAASYKQYAEEARQRLQEIPAMQDPGQPTALDLAQIHQAAQEAENARREAEHQKELADRERVLNERNEGRRYIEAVAAEHPITEGAPVVLIHWSEHPAFYSWDDDQLELSMAAAEIILARYDAEAAADKEKQCGYYKTKFSITWTDPETGEECSYNAGRYDLGDNEGGLVNHIRAYNPEVADYLQGWTVGGRVVSVTVAPWLEAYNKARKERAKQDAAEILDMVQMLTDDQLADAIIANPYEDPERRDIARFFLQELARRDRQKALEIFQKWMRGAA